MTILISSPLIFLFPIIPTPLPRKHPPHQRIPIKLYYLHLILGKEPLSLLVFVMGRGVIVGSHAVLGECGFGQG